MTRTITLACLMTLWSLPVGPAFAQPRPQASAEAPVPAAVLPKVGIDQNLNGQLPLDLHFRDEQGKTVRLGDYFGKKPIVLSLVYYRCPGLCTMTLNGMSRAFRPLQFSAGKEFDVITVSIDPKESPALAAEKKAEYLQLYGREGAGAGWHFLTGDAAEIEKLARAVGFRYVYDESTDQYAHAAGIMVATPAGKLSRYFYGLEYSSRDLRWGLVEASENRIGSLADVVNLLCFQYDPASGKYGVPVMRALRIGAVLTMLTLGGLVGFMLLRDRRLARVSASTPNAAALNAPSSNTATSNAPSSAAPDREGGGGRG